MSDINSIFIVLGNVYIFLGDGDPVNGISSSSISIMKTIKFLILIDDFLLYIYLYMKYAIVSYEGEK